MAKNPWHKRYHANALGGYAELSLELRGAYTTLLDMMYDSGWEEGIEDRERKIAGHMDISIRKWRLIRAELVEIGKIEILENGFLSNKRYQEERENALNLSEIRSKVGVKGGDKSGEVRRNANKIKEGGQPIGSDLLHSLAGGREDGEGEGEEDKKRDTDVSPKEPKRAAQMPADFLPVLTADMQSIVDRWNEGEFDAEVAQWRDHHTAKGNTAKDWQASLRTWLRNHQKWRKSNATSGRNALTNPRGNRPDPGLTLYLDAVAEIREAGNSQDDWGDGDPIPAKYLR